jgi:hypothetical protein
LAQAPDTCCASTVELESVSRAAGGRLLLRSTLVDTDPRRAMYRSPFLDGEAGEAAGGQPEQQGRQQDVRQDQAPPVQQQQGQPGQSAALAGAGLQRLESLTAGLSDKELRRKTFMSGVGSCCASIRVHIGVWLSREMLGMAPRVMGAGLSPTAAGA